MCVGGGVIKRAVEWLPVMVDGGMVVCRAMDDGMKVGGVIG